MIPFLEVFMKKEAWQGGALNQCERVAAVDCGRLNEPLPKMPLFFSKCSPHPQKRDPNKFAGVSLSCRTSGLDRSLLGESTLDSTCCTNQTRAKQE
jgi:hypothetical protein